ncbi:MAG: hypothetical protein RR337_09000, partial [Clostridia bacterium]
TKPKCTASWISFPASPHSRISPAPRFPSPRFPSPRFLPRAALSDMGKPPFPGGEWQTQNAFMSSLMRSESMNAFLPAFYFKTRA